MPICASCGRENPARARFCNACAAPLAPTAPAREARKTVTVFRCDVTGSTALGERLDPESLRRAMARYFETSKEVIERHGGTVEKFVGDAVMAMFGIPLLHEDDALRAVRAASEVREALTALNGELETDYGVRLELRMALNTGEVVTGTEERLATGDALNVVARLEQAALPGEILLGAETLGHVRHAVTVEAVGSLVLKGKGEPVEAYRLVSVEGSAGGYSRSFDSAIVGRVEELDQLRDAFGRSVRDRACHLFTLLGAAGVGKSRLAAEFVGSTGGATVVHGRCLSYGEGITYLPVVEIVGQLLGDEPATRIAGLELDETVAPVIAALLGDAVRVASTEETAWAVRKLLEAAAAASPLVVVFDDLQWGEQTFLDLVEHIADWSRDAPILLLCMARPEFLDRRPSWGGGKLNASTLLLEALSAQETDELIAQRPSGAKLSDDLRARIRETAEGNPLFVEQMLALLAESPTAGVRVPATIQALLAARLDQLDPAERAVLERGAVEGRVFHRGAVRALAPEEPQLDARLMGLLRKELVRPFGAQLPGEDAFRFRHQLIRDAAYEGLSKQDRAELHERYAGWFAGQSSDLVERDELLGYHLEQAYRYRAALGPSDAHGDELARAAADRLAAAGRRAIARDDFPAAAPLLERAAAVVPPDSPVRIELLLDLATALVLALDPRRNERTDAVLAEAVTRSEAMGDARLQAHARIELTRLHSFTDPEGRTEELRRVAEQAIPLFTELDDERGLVRAWEGISLAHNVWCQWGAQTEALEQAIVHARRCGEPWLERSIAELLIHAMVLGPTPVDEGLRRCAEVLDDMPGHARLECNYRATHAVLEAMSGRIDAARRGLSRTKALAAEIGLAHYFFWGQWSWQVEMLADDPVAAERQIRPEYERLLAAGEKGVRSTCAARLAEALYAQGRDDEAELFTGISRELAASDDIASQGLWRQTLAKILARRGRFEESERLAREAVKIIGGTDALSDHGEALMCLAEVLQVAGRAEEAVPLVKDALRLHERKGNIVWSSRARAMLADLEQAAPTPR